MNRDDLVHAYGPPGGGPPGYGPPGGAPPGYGPPPMGAPPGGYPPGGGYPGGPPPAGPYGFGPPGMGDPMMGGPMWGPPKAHPTTIVALVCGILAIPGACCCYMAFPLGAAAIACGIVGMGKVKRHPQMFTGKGMAIAGLVCGSVGVALDIVLIVLGMGLRMAELAGAGAP